MKIAVMSCIHSNYEALDAVLRDIDRAKAEKIFCLGDLVGYGPEPHAVVEMIRSLDIPTVQGCWDEDIVEGLNSCECSYPSVLAEHRGRNIAVDSRMNGQKSRSIPTRSSFWLNYQRR